MSIILEPESHRDFGSNSNSQTAADRIRHGFVACEIKFRCLGVQRKRRNQVKAKRLHEPIPADHNNFASRDRADSHKSKDGLTPFPERVAVPNPSFFC